MEIEINLKVSVDALKLSGSFEAEHGIVCKDKSVLTVEHALSSEILNTMREANIEVISLVLNERSIL